jgi:hypothetical protein
LKEIFEEMRYVSLMILEMEMARELSMTPAAIRARTRRKFDKAALKAVRSVKFETINEARDAAVASCRDRIRIRTETEAAFASSRVAEAWGDLFASAYDVPPYYYPVAIESGFGIEPFGPFARMHGEKYLAFFEGAYP